MNRIIILLGIAMVSLVATAQQRKLHIPDWNNVEHIAATKPDSINRLVARLSQQKIDTTMTYDERVLAYCGMSYLAPGAPRNTQITDALKKEDYKTASSLADSLLVRNPIHLQALWVKTVCCSQLSKQVTGEEAVGLLAKGQIYYNVMFRVLNTIASTGDGSREHPFYVTSVRDEYLFLREYLEIYEVTGQSIVQGPPVCDMLQLGKTSKYYDKKDIYFEISRILEIEEQAYGK